MKRILRESGTCATEVLNSRSEWRDNDPTQRSTRAPRWTLRVFRRTDTPSRVPQLPSVELLRSPSHLGNLSYLWLSRISPEDYYSHSIELRGRSLSPRQKGNIVYVYYWFLYFNDTEVKTGTDLTRSLIHDTNYYKTPIWGFRRIQICRLTKGFELVLKE